MDKKGEIYDLHEEIFNNGPLLKLTHEECEQLASFLVDTGYRKVSDVAREIFEEIENNYADFIYDGLRNIIVLTEKDFNELKKKFEGSENA